MAELMRSAELRARIRPEDYVTDTVGLPTLTDILAELAKPGRDPRERFEPVRFSEDVREISDLKPGMRLPGVVTNVAQFGAFVDVGVHQDGLVHVSQMSHKFVEDAREVVKTGQIVKVKVLEVDVDRKRISLTMKLDAQAPRRDAPRENRFENAGRGRGGYSSAPGGRGAGQTATGGAMASAFEKLKELQAK